MARAEDTGLIDLFDEFYSSCYDHDIIKLAENYPDDARSLPIDFDDLYRFDSDLAYDYRTKPERIVEYAEEALRLYENPVDVSLGQAHVRITGLPETTAIYNIGADRRGQLVDVEGVVETATEAQPRVASAAYECQRCGTLTRMPQIESPWYCPECETWNGWKLTECLGCGRQPPRIPIRHADVPFDDSTKVGLRDRVRVKAKKLLSR